VATPDKAAAPTGAPPTGAPPTGIRRWLTFKLVGQASAVVGLVAGVLGLLFLLVPGLKPGSGEQQSAKIELASVNDRATLREYLGAEGIKTGGLAPWALRRLGVLAALRYSSTGLAGKELPLVVSLTSRETGVTACRHTYRFRAGTGAPPAIRVWTPFPARARKPPETFNLHVTLFPPDGKQPALDAVDQNGIAGLDRPQPGPTDAPLPVRLC
jgi:hypothetical protein